MSSKTLYISDLDGTLLSPGAVLSPYTKAALARLCDRGMNISAATARTAATVLKIIDGTGINTPVVLMNGVCVYDLKKGEYVKINSMEKRAAREVMNVISRHRLAGFFYTITDNTLETFYESTDSPGALAFIEERQRLYGKVFTKLGSFEEILDKNLVYYSISDTGEKLGEAAREMKKIEGIRTEYYRDIYEENCFFLEVCSSGASKSTAVDFLRREYGFDKIVGFGDNYNDLPLLEACDEFYCVENAVDELKEKSDGILLPNSEDGVVKYLEAL